MEEYNIYDSNEFSFGFNIKYVSESGYFTYTIIVKSAEFKGKNTFCMSTEKLNELISILTKLANQLSGNYKIESFDDNSYIELEVINDGSLYLEGQIGGSHQDNYLHFKNKADQTLLTNLIKYLKSTIS